MSNKKQSSIEWLIDQIKNEDHHTEGELGNSCIDVNTLLMLCEQAKAMHKQEIIDAANKLLYHSTGPGDAAAEQYYNETFGGEDESNH